MSTCFKIFSDGSFSGFVQNCGSFKNVEYFDKNA